MLLTDIIAQYTKLTGQSNATNEGSNSLFSMAKSFIGNSTTSDIIQKFLGNLPPEIIQKLSALKVMGSDKTNTPDSSENFIAAFKQLASQFASKDKEQQVSELSESENANLIAKAAEMAKGFGINLDKLL